MIAYPLWLEGDSYMLGAYGANLGEFIATATARMSVITALTGSSMANIRDRIVANTSYAARKLIVWDGIETPGYSDPVSYCDQLQTALTALGHSRFVIIPPAVPYAGDTTAPLAIRAEMLTRWPANILDWRDWIANTAGVINLDRMANYPTDPLHLNILAMNEMTSGVVAFLAATEITTAGGAFQANAFQNNAFQVAAAAQDYVAFCTPQLAGRSVTHMIGY